MNWLTKQRQFRFGLRTLFVLSFVIALCTSAYMVGREFGAKDGFKLGYASGVHATDEGLKSEIKQAYDKLDQSMFLLQNAEKQNQVLKIESKKKNPTH